MRRPEVSFSHFMIQCMDIQQRLPNVGGPEVTIRKNINEEIRDHFKSFHEAFDRDLRKFIENKGTRINLNRITMRKPEVTFKLLYDTVYEDSK